jgi:ankyrin repeat protein
MQTFGLVETLKSSLYTYIDFLLRQESSNAEPLRLVKLLMERKQCADVNQADDEGCTPLHLAVMRGRNLYIEYLIDKGAKVDVSKTFSTLLFIGGLSSFFRC